MTSERYKRIEGWFRSRPAAHRLLRGATRYLTVLVYVSYAALCVWTLLTDRRRAVKILGVPAATFASGSLIRALINAKRPYEVLDIEPLVPKDTRGKSFPSRHVFCAAVIAMAFLSVSLPLGIFFLVVAVMIAATRLLAGVHWVRDVIAGLAAGIGAGVIGFFI